MSPVFSAMLRDVKNITFPRAVKRREFVREFLTELKLSKSWNFGPITKSLITKWKLEIADCKKIPGRLRNVPRESRGVGVII